MKTKMMVLAAVAALGISGVAAARGGAGMHGGPGMHGFGRALQAVELTAEQERMIEQQRAERRSAHEELREGHQAAKDQLQAELAKEQPDRARLHALLDEQLSERAEAAHDGLDAMLDVTATFTPEQREQFVQALEAAPEGGKEMKRGKGSPDRGARE